MYVLMTDQTCWAEESGVTRKGEGGGAEGRKTGERGCHEGESKDGLEAASDGGDMGDDSPE